MGSVGGVRSSRAVASAVPAAGAHAPTLPAPSMARNCTSVSPSAVMITELPSVALVQLAPPSPEVRYW